MKTIIERIDAVIGEARVTPQWEGDAILDIQKSLKKTKVNLDKLLKALTVMELNYGDSVLTDIDTTLQDRINQFDKFPKQFADALDLINQPLTDLEEDFMKTKDNYIANLKKLSEKLDIILAMKGNK